MKELESAQILESPRSRGAGRRSALEVRMDILKAAARGSVKPTHIMYSSNTSWMILQKNLESLIIKGFIAQKGDGPRVDYSITEKGVAVLRAYVDLVGQAGGRLMEVVQ